MTNQEFNFHFLEFDGQTIRVAIRPGKEHSIPLLIYNGIGASLELVVPFINSLSADTEVIAFDVPGVGESSTPVTPYRFSGLAKLTTRILDYFNYGKVNVIGVSWGGALAQQFAYDFPERCNKLILAATSTGAIMVPGKLKVLLRMASPRRYIQPSYKTRIAPEIYGGAFRHNPDLTSILDTSTVKINKMGYYWQLLAGFGWTSIHWLHKLKQPTLVLAGNDDPLIPLCNMRLIACMIPNSKLHVINDGHLFLLTSASIVAPLINNFLLEN